MTVDSEGNGSEPIMISSGWQNGEHIYTSSRPGIHVGKSGTVHTVWAASGDKVEWRYRANPDGEWEEEEIIAEISVGTLADRTLWEDIFGVIHFSDTGTYYYYRDPNGWSGPIKAKQTTPPDALFSHGGGAQVTGSET